MVLLTLSLFLIISFMTAKTVKVRGVCHQNARSKLPIQTRRGESRLPMKHHRLLYRPEQHDYTEQSEDDFDRRRNCNCKWGWIRHLRGDDIHQEQVESEHRPEYSKKYDCDNWVWDYSSGSPLADAAHHPSPPTPAARISIVPTTTHPTVTASTPQT